MIEVRGLAKTYRRGWWARGVDAVRSVSFECAPGECVGLLGANGAGKTTTLRMLATAIRPTGGSASIGGHDLIANPEAIRRGLGFLSTNTGLYLRLTPRELLDHYARLYGLDARMAKERMTFSIEALGIAGFLNKSCDNLSTGMRQRVSLARTMLHDPPVLILDEPTLGLDIEAIEMVIGFLEECRRMGKTILLSTHGISEVERLCSRILVLGEGRLVLDQSVPEAVAAHGTLASAVRAAMKGTP